MVIGYPIGGVLGGMAVQQILVTATWHGIFIFGCWASAVMIPVVLILVPESPVFLDRRRGHDALAKINHIFRRFGHAAAQDLTPIDPQDPNSSIIDIFKPDLLRTTILVTTAYFALFTSFYFLIKWVPKLVVDMGYEPSEAAGVLMWLNVGGATGGAIFGFLATRIPLKKLTIVVLAGAAAMIFWFGNGADNLKALATVVACAGFFTNAAICGIYSLLASVFPTQVRSTGTGFAIGVGRGGAVLAPVGAGYLFQAGFGLQFVALVMGSAALLAALLLFFLRGRPEV
jgi:MFS family permease